MDSGPEGGSFNLRLLHLQEIDEADELEQVFFLPPYTTAPPPHPPSAGCCLGVEQPSNRFCGTKEPKMRARQCGANRGTSDGLFTTPV
jgi:hypothetical protein